ncbi:TPA: hypothetical protein ACHKTJ_003772 [Escherichia coli]
MNKKTIKIDTAKIKLLQYQSITAVAMTNEISKTSLFPRRSRPVAGHPTGRTRQPDSSDERLIQRLA